jgi:hypothetical protein
MTLNRFRRAAAVAIVTPSLLVAVAAVGSCLRYGEVSARFDGKAPSHVATKTVTDRNGDTVTLVRASISGDDVGWFMLASGSYYCVVDARFVSRIQSLSKVTESEIPYPCKLPVTVYRCNALSVGGLTIKNLDIAAFDMSELSKDFEEEIVGMLGFPVFEHAVVKIEYGRNGADDRVSVYDPKSFRSDDVEWQPLGFYNFQPVLSARVNRTHRAPFVVDTGYNGTVAFYSAFTANHDILEGRPTRPEKSFTVCGESTELRSEVRVFEIAGNTYDYLAVSILQPGSITDVAPGRLGGFIGRGFLDEFEVVFDFPKRQIALIAE